MEVIHDTPFDARLMPILDKDGSEARVVVLKATYEMVSRGVLRIAEEQVPITTVDEHMGDPASSSVRHESDGAYFKPSTDVVVVGSVFAPKGRAVRSCLAGLAIGRTSKVVQVFGDRYWSCGLMKPMISEAKPFEETPICWERAFGGVDPWASPGKVGRWEPRNPIGTGFRVNLRAENIDGVMLPNFEDPGNLITSWKDKPSPQGLGFTGRGWMPRRQYSGTYDEAWRKYRMPIPPSDFDYRFFQGAPEGLVLPEILRGGEFVRALQFSKEGVDEFRVPRLNVCFHAVSKGRRVQLEGRLDTLVLQLASRRVILTWRGKYSVGLSEPADRVRVTTHDLK
ncbi:DUF2169 family type VI secretion system accessory protein [Myxococcus landrumensis]|uniref:DUF2169 domain-containing protein n=1 Tax=Myxococcus landrumensis TaxID=2813577 RepID=A0ABX7N8B5_9BACT|nr:DUF2169 domain-containing protein [Myxococcus landrumus]QSQ15000.1 DUF2169 domain-containing protein [Myxococcus landrumus]